ncbi:hypothetical protein ACJX0J_005419, partial [Zea mays]
MNYDNKKMNITHGQKTSINYAREGRRDITFTIRMKSSCLKHFFTQGDPNFLENHGNLLYSSIKLGPNRSKWNIFNIILAAFSLSGKGLSAHFLLQLLSEDMHLSRNVPYTARTPQQETGKHRHPMANTSLLVHI